LLRASVAKDIGCYGRRLLRRMVAKRLRLTLCVVAIEADSYFET